MGSQLQELPPNATACFCRAFSCTIVYYERYFIRGCTALIMILSRLQRAAYAHAALPLRCLSLPLSSPLHSMISAPHRSFPPAPTPAPRFFALRYFATLPSPSTPPPANPVPLLQQPAATTSAAFMRSSIFWGDTKPGRSRAALPSPPPPFTPTTSCFRHHGSHTVVG